MIISTTDKIFIKTVNDKLYNLLRPYTENIAAENSLQDTYGLKYKLSFVRVLDPTNPTFKNLISIRGNYLLLYDLYAHLYGEEVGKFILNKYREHSSPQDTYFICGIAEPEHTDRVVNDNKQILLNAKKFNGIGCRFFLNKLTGSKIDDTRIGLYEFNESGPSMDVLKSVLKSAIPPKLHFGVKSENDYINVYLQTFQALYYYYLNDNKITAWRVALEHS